MVYARCTRCGKELRKQAAYCPRCGAPVVPAASLHGRDAVEGQSPAGEDPPVVLSSGSERPAQVPGPPRSLAALLLLLSLLVFLLAWYATG
ncbi:MAG: zinc-ribbon domain-containing protein [Blastocatellia bacterium]